MKTCYIFGAADGLPDRFKKNEEDLVIAADSGINHLEKFGALPDIAVGILIPSASCRIAARLYATP